MFCFSAMESKNEEKSEIPFLPLNRLAAFLESLPSSKCKIFEKGILYMRSQSEALYSNLFLVFHLKCYLPIKFF